MKPLFWLFILGLLGLAIYCSGLNIAYYGDDLAYVYPEPSARILYFFVHKNPYHQFYRPVNSSLLAIIQAVFGLQTWPVHLLNITFHVLLSWLIYVFMIQRRLPPLHAVVGSLFMLLSQASAMAVLSNDTFSQISATFFGCVTLWLLHLSFTAFDNQQETPPPTGNRYYVASLFTFAVSLLSKEISVSFLPLSFAVLLAHHGKPGNWRGALRKTGIGIMPFALATALYLVSRSFLGLVQPTPGSGTYHLDIGVNILRNLALLIFAAAIPISTPAAFLLVQQRMLVTVAVVVLLSLALACLTVYGIWRSRPRRFFVWMGVLAILAMFPAVLMGHVSELYAYNSMPFLSVLVGGGLGRLVELSRVSRWRSAITTTVLVLLGMANVAGIQHKGSLMKENGARASELLEQIGPYCAQVPRNGKLWLVNPATKDPEYSVFLMNGFNVLLYGENAINQAAGRYDFNVEIVAASEAQRVGRERDALVLTLQGGRVESYHGAGQTRGMGATE